MRGTGIFYGLTAFLLVSTISFLYLTSVLELSFTASPELVLTNVDVNSPTANVTTIYDSALVPVVITMVMFGRDSALEGVITIKSALMHLSRPLDLHVICTEEVPPIVEERLALVSRPSYNVRVTYHKVTEDEVKDRALRAGVGSRYRAGVGALAKVFIYEILADVPRTIYVDTDSAFLLDPYLLWHEFGSFMEGQIVSFPTLGPNSNPSTICTCVMLLDLEQMRERHFMPSDMYPSTLETVATNETWPFAGIDPMKPEYGDQGLFWAIWKGNPEYFRHLSIAWDLTHCRDSYGLSMADGDDMMTEEVQLTHQRHASKAPERYAQVYPGIFHFNCQKGQSVWDDPTNLEGSAWSPMVQTLVRYKWIWLNRGDGSASMQIVTVNHTQFLDQDAYELP